MKNSKIMYLLFLLFTICSCNKMEEPQTLFWGRNYYFKGVPNPFFVSTDAGSEKDTLILKIGSDTYKKVNNSSCFQIKLNRTGPQRVSIFLKKGNKIIFLKESSIAVKHLPKPIAFFRNDYNTDVIQLNTLKRFALPKCYLLNWSYNMSCRIEQFTVLFVTKDKTYEEISDGSFWSTKQKEIIHKLQKGDYNYSQRYYNKVSKQGRTKVKSSSFTNYLTLIYSFISVSLCTFV